MKKRIVSALLASAFIPYGAFAQGTTPAPAEPPAAGSPADSEPATGTPPAGGADSGAAAGSTPPAGGTTTEPPADAAESDPAEEPADAAETPAAGEETETAADDSAAEEVEGPFVTVPPTGAWRTSDLEGKNVYDANDEEIGNISDTLVNEQGEVIAVLVGVGGFLGIGSKDVAVAMTALEFGPTKTEGLSTAPAGGSAGGSAGGATATAPAGGGTAPAGGAATEAPMEPPVVGEDNLPDRIVLNVTREELEAAPAYGEDEDSAAGGGGGMTGGATTGGATGGMSGGMSGGATTPAPGGTAPAN